MERPTDLKENDDGTGSHYMSKPFNFMAGHKNYSYLHITCSISVILCSSLPCLHGTCTDSPSGFSCSCDIKHKGVKCDQRMYMYTQLLIILLF